MVAISKTCGNIRCFDQYYQPGKRTLKASVLIIYLLCLLGSKTRAVFLALIIV